MILDWEIKLNLHNRLLHNFVKAMLIIHVYRQSPIKNFFCDLIFHVISVNVSYSRNLWPRSMEINEVVIFFRYFSEMYHIRGVFTKITEKIFYRSNKCFVLNKNVTNCSLKETYSKGMRRPDWIKIGLWLFFSDVEWWKERR